MKITVFSAKGGVGKTPISTNIAFDRDCLIATNDEYHGFDVVARIKDEDRCLVISPDDEFPEIPAGMDCVFDLGGTLSGSHAASIRSAIKQSNAVIVPVSNETKAIISASHTIKEIQTINENILVVATKLKRASGENSMHPWQLSKSFLRIKEMLTEFTGKDWPMLPLKYSAGYDAIFDQEQSLAELVKGGGADGYHYKMPAHQFDEIYQHLKQYE